ncbi:MAG: hypothetical protein K9H64_18625 [Bacteroidales bacterium]|nr:hypothetical protein [Bacteroidales bacterium]MCF8458034.1 hypothetical protein [Bacteroidales bacterium]
MRKTLILQLLLILTVSGYAQQIDSVNYYIQHFEYEKAILEIEKWEHDSLPSDLLFLKASAYKKVNKYTEAIAGFDELLKIDSTNTNNLVELADCYKSIGAYKKSQELYTLALIVNPENNYLLQQLANSYFLDDSFEKAKNQYLQAWQNDSSYYLAKQIARCCEKLEKADSAETFYKRALQFIPFDNYSTYRLGTIYKNQDSLAKASEIIDPWIEQDSTSSKMFLLSGSVHFLLKEYREAAELFDHCLILGDSSEYVFKFLGYSHFKNDRYDLARIYLKKAFATDSLNVDLCHALGVACDKSYYRPEAIEYLNHCIDLVTPSPDYFAAIYQDLASAYTSNFNHKEALDAYLKANEYTPGDTMLVFQIASHYDHMLKDEEQALRYYEKFLAMRPESKPVRQIQGLGIDVSYFDFVERRIAAINEEKFWNGEHPDTLKVEEKK